MLSTSSSILLAVVIPGPNDGNAKFVLEVVSGFSDKNNLKVGDRAEFKY